MHPKIKNYLFLILSIFWLIFLILNILVNTHIIYTYEVNKINTKEKIVMLTFDDGPNLTSDQDILDILEKEQVSGMFFQVGQNFYQDSAPESNISADYLDLEKRILTGTSYSWIGNHSYSHSNFLNKEKKAIDDINKNQSILQNIYKQILNIDINSELVPTRMPYLQYFNGTDYIAQKTNNNFFVCGYLGTDYNEERSGKERILKEYLTHLHPGQIFISHTKPYAKVWLLELIHTLKNQGYNFASFNPKSPNYYKNFGKLVL